MPQIDFITALGRLLRDGPLRDAYARQPAQTIAQLGVAESERPALLELNAADLEFQAEVLLRKRFETVLRLVPQTCANLGPRAWLRFAEYARAYWPSGEHHELQDIQQFFRHLLRKDPRAVSPSEKNRIEFAMKRLPFAIHFVPDIPFRKGLRRGLQIFFRRWSGSWQEYLFYLAV